MEYGLSATDFWNIILGGYRSYVSTLFFIMERFDVKGKWRTSLSVAAINRNCILALLIHERCLDNNRRHSNSTGYVDWIITVPLQIVEFYLILAAVTKVRATLLKLLSASVVMLVFG